jgi:hypothetical protein
MNSAIYDTVDYIVLNGVCFFIVIIRSRWGIIQNKVFFFLQL